MQQEGKSSAYGRLKELRRTPSFVVEENVIGFEADANTLLAKLLENEPRRFVISIFGMGGLGKTTLAKKLYHSIDVRNKFDRCAWVSVSQEYRTQDLLLRIIESFKVVNGTKEIEKFNEQSLERYLHKSLEGYSYLVVIDDVWHKEAWESLRRAFPDNKNGSRVIITTRIREVAERSDEKIHVHELRFLTPDESWKLFCDKAFPSLNSDEGLDKLGREMVGKCGGLPLAIVVLGGLLSAKKPQGWHVVRDHIWRHLRNDSIHISYLLALSFNDLSYQLKLCFLYLGLLPEDFEICTEKLIQLWVAEGFIEGTEDQLMEEVAQDNLNELINRSLIQIEKKCWGRVITCRVHDLLRDLAIEKAKQLNFIHICDEDNHSSRSSITVTCRRQAIYSGSGSESWFWLQQYNPLSRSLLFFQQPEDKSFRIAQHLAFMCSRFRLLRILDIDGSQSNNTVPKSRDFPKEIEELIQLRYLGLTNGYIHVFPPSIVKLKRLQTLRLHGFEWFFDRLPTEIGKLQELRHLIGNFRGTLPVHNLTNLQTLKNIDYGSWTKINPVKLVNLRELRIISGRPNEKAITLDSVTTLQSLRILSVWLRPGQAFTSLKPLGHCPCLADLRLNGKLEKLPIDMDKLLPNLECLKFSGSLLQDDPMASLEKLPNLMILVLSFNSYSGKKLTCSAKGFPRLEILQIDLKELEEWQVDEDAMPMLRGLKIVENSKLRITERLRSIPLPGEWECEDGRIPINNSSYIQV
ncbi:putative disease resistance RPP13-like protein 3 [Pistacia vera]|uniref:putative disease resistance RPP13-like protein 3 n=1 Tax=Pistacia vera TaxID=55513 RepID=UPI0012637A68|nr:putative disease resistance RPP13-like protein 3 [Pistacia vera]